MTIPSQPGHGAETPLITVGRLTERQIAQLRGHGEIRPTVAGEVLFREGGRVYDFFVIMSGRVRIVDHQAGVERHLAIGSPGDFIAELALLTGERPFTTAVVVEPGSVLAVPLDGLQALISRDQALGSLIVRTVLERRQQRACGSSGRGSQWRRAGLWSSPPATGFRTSGSVVPPSALNPRPSEAGPPPMAWPV